MSDLRSRIEKLERLAASTTFPEEAENARRMAERLRKQLPPPSPSVDPFVVRYGAPRPSYADHAPAGPTMDDLLRRSMEDAMRAELIRRLDAVRGLLDRKDESFARSLSQQWHRTKRLSDKQWFWVKKLTRRGNSIVRMNKGD